MKLTPQSTPPPELARAIAQLLNEGSGWTTACRQLRVNVSRATHWRTEEQPWFGLLCRLAVMAAFIESIERLNPGTVSKERPHLLDAAESVRAALHAPLPLALEQLLTDPPFNVGPADDVLVREGVWRMEREVRREHQVAPDAIRTVLAAAEGEDVELKGALRALREGAA